MIRKATVADTDFVVELVSALYEEIGHQMAEGVAQIITRKLILEDSRYSALLAMANDAERPVGVLTLVESCATYAGGYFGIIQELYIETAWRSQGIGCDLVAHARQIALDRGWRRLEVTAPFGSRFSRSVEFYRANGFEDSGPRLFLGLSRGAVTFFGDSKSNTPQPRSAESPTQSTHRADR